MDYINFLPEPLQRILYAIFSCLILWGIFVGVNIFVYRFLEKIFGSKQKEEKTMKNCLNGFVVAILVIYTILLLGTGVLIICLHLSWYQQVSLLFIDVLFAVFGYHLIALIKHNDDE